MSSGYTAQIQLNIGFHDVFIKLEYRLWVVDLNSSNQTKDCVRFIAILRTI